MGSINPFAKSKSNLVWLEQPEGDYKNNGNPWVERQITGDDGPGVGFTLCDLDNDNKMEVVASQFFAKQQLSLWWCNSATGHWSDCMNGTNVGSAVIDAAEGAPFFNVEWVVMNNPKISKAKTQSGLYIALQMAISQRRHSYQDG